MTLQKELDAMFDQAEYNNSYVYQRSVDEAVQKLREEIDKKKSLLLGTRNVRAHAMAQAFDFVLTLIGEKK